MHPLPERIEALLAAPVPYLTDGGLETTLIFHDGLDLPLFAAFPLLDSAEGREHLSRHYRTYFDVAESAGRGFVLDVPVWRASPDWGAALGYRPDHLDRVNREGAEFARALRWCWETPGTPVLVNGVIGPRGDGYVADGAMGAAEARACHAPQVAALVRGGVGMVSAITMTHAAEAIGIARASIAAGCPAVISFAVEPDGCLPSGQPLKNAIAEVDEATGGDVLYYMINCAHPDHFSRGLAADEPWRFRIGGLRANASRMSNEKLDDAEALDAGDPVEFGHLHQALSGVLPNIRVIGGCCGTDMRHVRCAALAA